MKNVRIILAMLFIGAAVAVPGIAQAGAGIPPVAVTVASSPLNSGYPDLANLSNSPVRVRASRCDGAVQCQSVGFLLQPGYKINTAGKWKAEWAFVADNFLGQFNFVKTDNTSHWMNVWGDLNVPMKGKTKLILSNYRYSTTHDSYIQIIG